MINDKLMYMCQFYEHYGYKKIEKWIKNNPKYVLEKDRNRQSIFDIMLPNLMGKEKIFKLICKKYGPVSTSMVTEFINKIAKYGILNESMYDIITYIKNILKVNYFDFGLLYRKDEFHYKDRVDLKKIELFLAILPPTEEDFTYFVEYIMNTNNVKILDLLNKYCKNIYFHRIYDIVKIIRKNKEKIDKQIIKYIDDKIIEQITIKMKPLKFFHLWYLQTDKNNQEQINKIINKTDKYGRNLVMLHYGSIKSYQYDNDDLIKYFEKIVKNGLYLEHEDNNGQKLFEYIILKNYIFKTKFIEYILKLYAKNQNNVYNEKYNSKILLKFAKDKLFVSLLKIYDLMKKYGYKINWNQKNSNKETVFDHIVNESLRDKRYILQEKYFEKYLKIFSKYEEYTNNCKTNWSLIKTKKAPYIKSLIKNINLFTKYGYKFLDAITNEDKKQIVKYIKEFDFDQMEKLLDAAAKNDTKGMDKINKTCFSFQIRYENKINFINIVTTLILKLDHDFIFIELSEKMWKLVYRYSCKHIINRPNFEITSEVYECIKKLTLILSQKFINSLDIKKIIDIEWFYLPTNKYNYFKPNMERRNFCIDIFKMLIKRGMKISMDEKFISKKNKLILHKFKYHCYNNHVNIEYDQIYHLCRYCEIVLDAYQFSKKSLENLCISYLKRNVKTEKIYDLIPRDLKKYFI